MSTNIKIAVGYNTVLQTFEIWHYGPVYDVSKKGRENVLLLSGVITEFSLSGNVCVTYLLFENCLLPIYCYHGLFTNGWETVRAIKFEIILWAILIG